MRALADKMSKFINANGLAGVDAVGSSMGARLALELARHDGVVGTVVSLNPRGFWQGWQRHAFYSYIYLSIRLLRLLSSALPRIIANTVGRALLLAQFSSRPTHVPANIALDELRGYVASPAFYQLLYHNLHTAKSNKAHQNMRSCTRLSLVGEDRTGCASPEKPSAPWNCSRTPACTGSSDAVTFRTGRRRRKRRNSFRALSRHESGHA